MGTFTRNLIFGLGALGILWGCGSGTHSGEAARASAASAAARKAAKAADTMVSAVTLNKTASTAPVQVKFELRDRPDVGQPANIDLIIVPMSGAIDRVSGKVESDEGLDLLDGVQIPATDRPAEGVPVRHAIKVQAERDGIFTFSAVLVVESGGQPVTETFSMPVIAGAGMPDLPATPGSATPADRGSAPAATGSAATAPAKAVAIPTKGTPGGAAAVQ
jgi:hypothetical protein